MIKLENHLGTIEISEHFFVNLIGSAVTQCFGVAGMSTTGPTQGVKNYLKSIKWMPFKSFPEKGIRVRYQKQKMNVEIHILVTYGTNVPAVVKSITEKVTYAVEDITGIQVNRVVVYVDGMTKN